MNVLVCIKRVPDTGAKFSLSQDGQRLETGGLEFTISPHEECAVEEAIRLSEDHGGEVTVLSLGPARTTEQLREAIAKGAHRAILLESEDEGWDAHSTARAIVEAVRGRPFDVLLFGHESADWGQSQVGPQVATLLDLPCVTGIKALELQGGRAVAKRQRGHDWEVFEVPLPAAFTVKEGLNKPRHPSLRGIMAAKRAPLEQRPVSKAAPKLVQRALVLPEEARGELELLGEGPAAVPRLVEVLKALGVI